MRYINQIPDEYQYAEVWGTRFAEGKASRKVWSACCNKADNEGICCAFTPNEYGRVRAAGHQDHNRRNLPFYCHHRLAPDGTMRVCAGWYAKHGRGDKGGNGNAPPVQCNP